MNPGPTTTLLGDCLEHLRTMPDRSVDLVFTSPPYEVARTYGIDFALRGQAWVDWCIPRFMECLRVCRGLVAWVVEGQTRQYRWSAVPVLLMADLHRAGVNLRKPPAFHRSGIPGSGGPDWLRNDYETIICASQPGRLPWSDNTACGHPPKCKPGGAPTHRLQDGRRVRTPGVPIRYFGTARGDSEREQKYIPPTVANPGNVIRCSGGHLGDKIAHLNEAPFPEALAEFFIKSFCPPDGTVLDPFMGGGTTLAVAARLGRRSIGIDIRPSQLDLTARRLAPTPDQGAGK